MRPTAPNISILGRTLLTVGSGKLDDIKVNHAGIGEYHLSLTHRGDTVKIVCNNENGFWIHNGNMYIKSSIYSYIFMEGTFDLYLDRSVNPNFKPTDPPNTKFTDTPNTNIKVDITPPVSVVRAAVPVLTPPVPPVSEGVKVRPPVSVFTTPVLPVPEGAQIPPVPPVLPPMPVLTDPVSQVPEGAQVSPRVDRKHK